MEFLDFDLHILICRRCIYSIPAENVEAEDETELHDIGIESVYAFLKAARQSVTVMRSTSDWLYS